MEDKRIEFKAAHGDERVGQLKFIVRGTGEEAARRMALDGLGFIEGKSMFTTYLLHSFAQATEVDPGRVNVLVVPPDFHVGYSVDMTVYVDREHKLVTGAPIRYAGGRKLLALYEEADTETKREQIEAEIAAGADIETQPSYIITAGNILGSFKNTPAFEEVMESVQVAAEAFEGVNTERAELALQEMFECREAAQVVMVPTMVHELVIGMVEAVIISLMRSLRWQGLALLGYKFEEDGREIVIEHSQSLEQHRTKLDDYRRRLESSLFTGELAWLKNYVTRQLDLMRIEMDGTNEDEAER